MHSWYRLYWTLRLQVPTNFCCHEIIIGNLQSLNPNIQTYRQMLTTCYKSGTRMRMNFRLIVITGVTSDEDWGAARPTVETNGADRLRNNIYGTLCRQMSLVFQLHSKFCDRKTCPVCLFDPKSHSQMHTFLLMSSLWYRFVVTADPDDSGGFYFVSGSW